MEFSPWYHRADGVRSPYFVVFVRYDLEKLNVGELLWHFFGVQRVIAGRIEVILANFLARVICLRKQRKGPRVDSKIRLLTCRGRPQHTYKGVINKSRSGNNCCA